MMSKKINDGGPAFPPDYSGMTLRQWYTVQAAAGLLAWAGTNIQNNIAALSAAEVAKAALGVADALIAAGGTEDDKTT
jgi:hypothetical protein